MIIVETNNNKNYKLNNTSSIKLPIYKFLMLKRQRIEQVLKSIKSIDIQVKDIKMMKYSNNIKLLLFYVKASLKDFHDDEDYINIPNNDKNKNLLYSILNADWILNKNRLDAKSNEELIYDKLIIYKNIRKNIIDTKIDARFKNELLKYKYDSLLEYLDNRENIKSKIKKLDKNM